MIGLRSYLWHVLTIPAIQITANLDKPARIGSIRVEGAHRTRSSFLGSLVKPYLAAPADGSSPRATTLEDVVNTTREVQSLLQDTQVFKSIKPTLERSWSPLAERDDIDIVFHCTERGKYIIRTATDVGNQEGSAVRMIYFSICCRTD